MSRHRPAGLASGGLLWNPEVHVAGKRAARSYYLNRAGGCTGGYGRSDFGTRKNFEDSRGAVEANAARAGKFGSQDLDGRSHLAGCKEGFLRTRLDPRRG